MCGGVGGGGSVMCVCIFTILKYNKYGKAIILVYKEKIDNFYKITILVEIKVFNWLVLKCISWMSRTSGVKLEKVHNLYILLAEREANVIFQKLIIGGCGPLFFDLSFNTSLSPSLLASSLSQVWVLLCARHYPHERILSLLFWLLNFTYYMYFCNPIWGVGGKQDYSIHIVYIF